MAVRRGERLVQEPHRWLREESPVPGVLPSMDTILQGLGGWGLVLYISSGLVTAVLIVQFSVLVRQFILCVEAVRLTDTIWVTSIFSVLSVFNLVSRMSAWLMLSSLEQVSIVLPLASEFVWLAYKIYLSIAMCHFVDLTMTW
jgi:hypothetical protein